MTDTRRVHVGCGARKLDQFVNIDTEPGADLRCDVRRGLPFPNQSVDILFSEHFIEYLSRDGGIRFFQKCHRVLNLGGICRIATADLQELTW